MNRRGILKAVLGMAALPAAGPNPAAAMLGVGSALSTNEPMPLSAMATDCHPSPSAGWWGSNLQVAFDARRNAQHHISEGACSHMKSWGRGFRLSVIEREQQAMILLEQRMNSDSNFAEMVWQTLGGRNG